MGRVALALLLALMTAGCATRGRVMPSTAAGSYQDVSRANRLREQLRAQTRAREAVGEVERTVPIIPTDKLALAPVHRAPITARPRGAPRLSWPVEGPVTSGYGRRGRRHHDGIDIQAPHGTEVRAAAEGEVAFVGSLRGYGRMVIIVHPGGFTTVYAHNAQHYVREGMRVRRGQPIASVGRSGRTTGRVLHFEVRQNNVAYDPLAVLPTLDQRVARGE
jgi:murein DD-endopeptidase MepM/ murein hydrolase activator NlpD